MTTVIDRVRFDSNAFSDAPQGRWYVHQAGFGSGFGILSVHDDNTYHTKYSSADARWRAAPSHGLSHERLSGNGWVLVADTTDMQPQPAQEAAVDLGEYVGNRIADIHAQQRAPRNIAIDGVTVDLNSDEAEARLMNLVAKLNVDASRAKRELEAFKAKVVEVGGEYADRNDFCSVYDDLMIELGLPTRKTEVTISGTIRFTINAEVGRANRNRVDDWNFVRESIRMHAIERAVSGVDVMDDDWESSSISFDGIEITDVEED